MIRLLNWKLVRPKVLDNGPLKFGDTSFYPDEVKIPMVEGKLGQKCIKLRCQEVTLRHKLSQNALFCRPHNYRRAIGQKNFCHLFQTIPTTHSVFHNIVQNKVDQQHILSKSKVCNSRGVKILYNSQGYKYYMISFP